MAAGTGSSRANVPRRRSQPRARAWLAPAKRRRVCPACELATAQACDGGQPWGPAESPTDDSRARFGGCGCRRAVPLRSLRAGGAEHGVCGRVPRAGVTFRPSSCADRRRHAVRAQPRAGPGWEPRRLQTWRPGHGGRDVALDACGSSWSGCLDASRARPSGGASAAAPISAAAAAAAALDSCESSCNGCLDGVR